MRPTYPVLIVSERRDVVEQVASWLDDHLVDAVGNASEASRIIAALPLAGLIIDAGSVPRDASGALVRRFSASQPAGRIAVLGDADDFNTIVAFSVGNPRVEMFFAPWDGDAVMAFLHLAEMAAGSPA